MRAMERYERAIRIDPNHRRAKTNLGFLCRYHRFRPLHGLDQKRSRRGGRTCSKPVQSSVFQVTIRPLRRRDLPAHKGLERPFRRTAKTMIPDAWKFLGFGSKTKGGFVSPDFRNHVSARFLYPLFENRDADAYEAVFYPELGIEDEYTEHYRTLCDAWYPTRGDEKRGGYADDPRPRNRHPRGPWRSFQRKSAFGVCQDARLPCRLLGLVMAIPAV